MGTDHATARNQRRLFGRMLRKRDDEVRRSLTWHGSRNAIALASGTVVAGVLAYVFIAIVTRSIGAEAAAPIAVLWTYWSAAAAILVFPLQHWIVRRVSAEGGEHGVRAGLPRVAALVVAAAACAFAVSWLFGETLFGRDDALFPLTIAAVTVGAGFVGVVRGRLASRERFVATAAAIAGENAVRVAGAGTVALLLPVVELYAVVLASGALIGLVWPSAVTGILSRSGHGGLGGLGFLGGIAGSSLVAQLVLTSGPVVLTLIGGGPGRVTSVFTALALYRAPYLVALGVVTQLTGYLTALVLARRERALGRVRFAAVGVMPVVGLVGGAMAYLLGADVVATVFGSSVRLPPMAHAWLVVGTVFALGNLVLTLQLVARRVTARSLTAWLCAVIVATIVVAIVRDPLAAVLSGFVAAEVVALAGLFVCDMATGKRHGVNAG